MIECKHCKFISKIIPKITTNREYWMMTEIFVYLHGSDECDGKTADGIWATKVANDFVKFVWDETWDRENDETKILSHHHEQSDAWKNLHKIIYKHADKITKAIGVVWEKSWKRKNAKQDK